MKICMLTTSFPRFGGDGAGIFVYHLARALNEAGHEVKVVAPWDRGSAGYEVMEGTEVYRFRYSPWSRLNIAYGAGGIPEKMKASPGILSALPLFSVSFMARAAGVAARCHVINAHWLYSGLVAGVLSKALGVPSVLTLRGSDMKLIGSHKMLRPAARLSFGWVDRVTAVSSSLKELAVRMGLREDKAETIPNGVDSSLFSPMHPAAAAERLGLPRRKRMILFVGSFTENKGLRTLLEAFESVLHQREDVLLALVGEGPLEEELRGRTLRRGLKDYVLFPGTQPQSRLPLWYNSAELLVLPSLSEGRPNVVLEAMACGTPIAASDIPGVRELAVEGGAFQMFKTEDADGLAEIIIRTIGSGVKETEGASLRRHLMDSGLTWERCAERYVRCYIKARGKKRCAAYAA